MNETYPTYLWYPEPIRAQKNSSAVLTHAMARFNTTRPTRAQFEKYFRREIALNGLGITDLTPTEWSDFYELLKQKDFRNITNVYDIDQYLTELVNKRAELGVSDSGKEVRMATTCRLTRNTAHV